jgi:EAL domain-containing protein (putative c-di-GMP-specific phosphodiesterase class I)
MARAPAPTNDLLTTGLSERIIPVEVRSVVEIGSSRPIGALARISQFAGFEGSELERFAIREGRGRELLIYLMERAARQMRNWRARGFHGTLYVALCDDELEDRTLATSFDIIGKTHKLEPASFTFTVPLSEYLERRINVSSAITRIRKAGCGVAMTIDGIKPPKFERLGQHPFSAALLGGRDVWKRLRTIGPGRLGAVGAWIGWAESQGIERTATGIASAIDQETARLYGFGRAEGPHYCDFVPARSFIGADGHVVGALESAVVSAFGRSPDLPEPVAMKQRRG